MHTVSQHILAEFRGCDVATLNDLGYIESCMRVAAEKAGATVVSSSFHQFGPHGVSGVLVLAESHLSVHTWPEHAYAATDIYTCGDTCRPERAHDSLRLALRAKSCEVMAIERGLSPGGLSPSAQGMRVVSHDADSSDISARSLDSALAERAPGQNRSLPSRK